MRESMILLLMGIYVGARKSDAPFNSRRKLAYAVY